MFLLSSHRTFLLLLKCNLLFDLHSLFSFLFFFCINEFWRITNCSTSVFLRIRMESLWFVSSLYGMKFRIIYYRSSFYGVDLGWTLVDMRSVFMLLLGPKCAKLQVAKFSSHGRQKYIYYPSIHRLTWWAEICYPPNPCILDLTIFNRIGKLNSLYVIVCDCMQTRIRKYKFF